jgi:integrase
MSRRRNLIPTYRIHKQSGHAVSDFYDPLTGRKRTVSLGKGDSPESRREHARLVAEVAVGAPAGGRRGGLTVAELLLAFLRHAEGHYRRADGTPTWELANFKQVMRVVRETHGHVPAAEFGPLALKAVRQAMIDRGWARRSVNQQVGRVKRIFKFGVQEELVPPAVLDGLKAVAGLQAGRTAARETAPVEPVPDELVDRTLPHLNRHVGGLIRFQRLTGCRPGEACALRRCDLDMTNPVWVYRPVQHKTRHRGRPRVVHVGPQAQALLAEFPTAMTDEYVFSPIRERDERTAARAANRATKYYPSRQGWQQRKAAPKRAPGVRYTVSSYGYAIRRACAAHGLPAWAPNQLRHTFGTVVRRAFGLEGAQVGLGHSRADVTQVYAERDDALAARIATAIG